MTKRHTTTDRQDVIIRAVYTINQLCGFEMLKRKRIRFNQLSLMNECFCIAYFGHYLYHRFYSEGKMKLTPGSRENDRLLEFVDIPNVV